MYDVEGNRIARIDPDGGATAFVGGSEFSSSTKGLSTTRFYEHAGDVVASRTVAPGRPGDIIWLGSDQHDSASWAVNAVTRVETIRYADPYGTPRTAGGANGAAAWPAGQRGFVGGVADPNGLTLLGARYYDPKLGAFLSVDPEIDENDPQRMHPYAYANNNPITFADSDGLFWGAIKNAAAKVGNAVANTAASAAKAVVNNAGTIASVAGTVAMVAAVLPPPAQVVAAAAGAVAAVAGVIDTVKTCSGGDKMGCAMGVAGMIPGVRQAKTAARGLGAAKNAAKNSGKKADAPQPSGCKTGNSFLPGTQVLMDDGSHKAIEDITTDDRVEAFDPVTRDGGARPVITPITGSGDKELVRIDVDGNGDGASDGTVTATGGHEFWAEDERSWLFARDLEPGRRLLTPDGVRVTVLAIVAYGAVAEVHNLSVHGIPTYYVQVGGVDVLVHNQGDGDSCPISLEEYADQQLNVPKVEIVSEYTSPSGAVYRSTNRHGLKAPPFLQKRFDRVKTKRGSHHGGCAEMGCLIQAYRAEGHRATKGGKMRTLAVRRPQNTRASEHGKPFPACPMCAVMLRWRRIQALMF